jgi:hypothetical protein
VLTARFIVVLRQLNGLVAGSIGMPWPHFVVANILGAALWAGLWDPGSLHLHRFLPPVALAHRADPEGRVSEKWTRFSAKTMRSLESGASDPIPKVGPLLGPML